MLESKFGDYLQNELNYSKHTVVAYLNDLNGFKDFIDSKELKDVVKSDIKSYLAVLVKQGLEKRSINRKLSSLKSFYQFLYITKTIDKMPTEGIKSLKFNKKVQIPFNEQEMSNLFDSNLFEDNFEGIRDRSILLTFYHTGIRRSELISLKLSDVNFKTKELKVLGKGRKERIIPINEELAEVLEKYLDAAKSESIEINDTLFITQKGKRLDPKLVYRITNDYLSLVTEKQKKSPHMIRHTFATHLLNNGSNISAIQELLGHKSLASTTHYMYNDINQLKEVFNLAHPRESK